MDEFTAAAVASYDRFMGRYAVGLAPKLADAVGVAAGMRVVDVGCGPGGLTTELARRAGEQNVAGIDPAPGFAAACQERLPGADIREGVAEELPWDDGEFDAALSSLVVAFMTDADQGIREMARVTKPGGTVAACMWDFAGGGMTMIATFWRAARSLDPSLARGRTPTGGTEGDIAQRMRVVGLDNVTESTIETSVDYAGFDDYWEPFTHGGGPSSGAYLAKLDDDGRARLREACRALLPDGSFTLHARAWLAIGTAAG
jgi:ubiquinone/menaquinone biosynthesis C-methylase UbiE